MIFSSVVIDYVLGLRNQARGVKLIGVAYICFDYKDQEKQSSIQVVSSLAQQLCAQLPNLPTEVEELYRRLKSECRTPNLEEISATLLKTSGRFSEVFFVFDALDEAELNTSDNRRTEFLNFLHQMGKAGVRIFLTSRPHPEDIGDSLCQSEKIILSAQEEDIRIYIGGKIEKNPKVKRLVLKGKCKENIMTELVACSAGMYEA